MEGSHVENLADLAPPEWREKPEFETARFRFFPTGIAVGSPQSEIVRELFPLIAKLSAHPVGFAIVQLGEGTKFRVFATEVFYSAGQRQLLALAGERDMLPGDYMVIFSPVVTTGTSVDESPAEDAINACRGLMTSLFGHAAADTPAYSCDSYLREVRTSLPSPTIENFPPVGTYAFVERGELATLGERVAIHLDDALRRRLETAFLFIGSAAAVVDPAIRLVNTWIALEVACGSRGKAEEAIKAASRDNETYLRLKTARDEFFHQGKRRGLKTDDERVAHAALMNVLLAQYRLPLAIISPMRSREQDSTIEASD